MADAVTEQAELIETLRVLREELARLSDRVAALEARPPAAAARAAGNGAGEEVADEVLLAVIAAAVAAFLGKRPRIRSVRVLSSPEWAREGRTHIQASHALSQR